MTHSPRLHPAFTSAPLRGPSFGPCPTVKRSKIQMTLAFLTFVATSFVFSASSLAEATETPGRIAFDFPHAPPATVEVQLKHGLLSALTDIVAAAVDGATEGLMESGDGRPAIQESAELLQAVKQILASTNEVVREIRVNMYENMSDSQSAASMADYYRTQLAESAWDHVVQIREGDTHIVVFTQQAESTIRGVFVMVSEGDELLLANAVCELSPERVKALTNQATKVGLKFGLADVLESAMREVRGRR